MPGIDGIEPTRRLRAAHPPDTPPYVIFLITFDLHEYVYAGLRAGAAGFYNARHHDPRGTIQPASGPWYSRLYSFTGHLRQINPVS
jgi:CheY-like chemotaxis protein